MRTVVCGLGLTSRTSVVFCFVYFIFFLRVTWGCSGLWYELSCWVGVLEKAIAANYALRTGCVKKKRLWMVKDFFLAFAAPFPVLPALLAFICLPFFQLIHKSSMLAWCVVWAADSGIQSTTLIQFMGEKKENSKSCDLIRCTQHLTQFMSRSSRSLITWLIRTATSAPRYIDHQSV